MAVNPQPLTLRSGAYADEPATFGDVTSLAKYLNENHVRPSLSSPPLANDIGEFEFVLDKATLRLYTKLDGNLVYFQGV
jgi:hypothetical protein